MTKTINDDEGKEMELSPDLLGLKELLVRQASGMSLDHTKLSDFEYVGLLWDWFEMGRVYERNIDSWCKEIRSIKGLDKCLPSDCKTCRVELGRQIPYMLSPFLKR